MSNITSNIGRKFKNSLSGIGEVYLFPYVDYSFSQITLVNQEVTVFPATTVYDLYPVSSKFTETTELEGGSVVWNQSFSIDFPRITEASEAYMFSFKDYRAIYIDRNGSIRILGLYNGLEATVTQESGQGKSDFGGYRVTFSGKEDNQAYYLSSLLGAGFTIHTTINYIFEGDCNFVFENGVNYIFE